MLPLNLSKKCTKCGFETNEPQKYFFKRSAAKDGFGPQCKKCNEKISDIYLNTERGFMIAMYNTMKKKVRSIRYRNLSDKEKEKHRCHITKDEFFELWENHKKKFGYRCRLTGVKIVCQRARGKIGAAFLGYSNGVSADRLDPSIGYTKDNIIFISNEANKLKNAVTKELCIKILELYKEKNL